MVADGRVYGCLNEAEDRATLDRQGHFEIGVELVVSAAGRVTSAHAFGDASKPVRECIERRALDMTFQFIVACPSGTQISRLLRMGSTGGAAQ